MYRCLPDLSCFCRKRILFDIRLRDMKTFPSFKQVRDSSTPVELHLLLRRPSGKVSAFCSRSAMLADKSCTDPTSLADRGIHTCNFLASGIPIRCSTAKPLTDLLRSFFAASPAERFRSLFAFIRLRSCRLCFHIFLQDSPLLPFSFITSMLFKLISKIYFLQKQYTLFVTNPALSFPLLLSPSAFDLRYNALILSIFS